MATRSPIISQAGSRYSCTDTCGFDTGGYHTDARSHARGRDVSRVESLVGCKLLWTLFRMCT